MFALPSSTMPRIEPIVAENIPELLQKQTRWIGWKAGPLKPNGKFDKIPVDLQTGRSLNGRDTGKWRTFVQGVEAYQMGTTDGIGFALSDKHPVVVDGLELYVTVADFDNCLSDLDKWRDLWRELGNPFTEVSPSNNGIHMWGLTRHPLKGGNAGKGRELYSGGRFVTMTGIGSKGVFGECPGFVELEREWFLPSATFPETIQANAPLVDWDIPDNLRLAHWFEELSPLQKNACLAEMLKLPAVIAIADTSDDASTPNWRTVLASCVRSGAPDAYSLCKAWAQSSPRFDVADFDNRWKSYARS